MLKIKDAITDILSSNPYLEYGLYHGLFNTARVAEFVKPFIEVRTKKTVSEKALEMALLRFRKKEQVHRRHRHRPFRLEKISASIGLRIETFVKNPATHKTLQKYYEFVAVRQGFCSITEGLEEITFVFEERFRDALTRLDPARSKVSLDHVGALYAQFSVEYLKFPGMLHHILHLLVIQGINILETASTSTSIVIYLKESDIKLAFNTLHDLLVSSVPATL